MRPCSLLDSLIYIFDTLWARATPISFDAEGRLRDTDDAADGEAVDDRLLNLLATGMTDQAIAHQLGVSYRTAHRRIAALMETLGAKSRYQAGLMVGRNSTQ